MFDLVWMSARKRDAVHAHAHIFTLAWLSAAIAMSRVRALNIVLNVMPNRGEHECDANPGAMMRDCAHTCNVCTLACEDKYSDCPNWAEGKVSMFGGRATFRAGCDQDAAFMLPNCPHSCGLCARLHVFPSRTDPAGGAAM